ncbi:MAG: hypothetical protein LBS68_02850 [Puniceicoccales bacterium]|jgi:hypothetical protein|nr:hypothetical protein [Puniceicoccales bacterium]
MMTLIDDAQRTKKIHGKTEELHGDTGVHEHHHGHCETSMHHGHHHEHHHHAHGGGMGHFFHHFSVHGRMLLWGGGVVLALCVGFSHWFHSSGSGESGAVVAENSGTLVTKKTKHPIFDAARDEPGRGYGATGGGKEVAADISRSQITSTSEGMTLLGKTTQDHIDRLSIHGVQVGLYEAKAIIDNHLVRQGERFWGGDRHLTFKGVRDSEMVFADDEGEFFFRPLRPVGTEMSSVR